MRTIWAKNFKHLPAGERFNFAWRAFNIARLTEGWTPTLERDVQRRLNALEHNDQEAA